MSNLNPRAIVETVSGQQIDLQNPKPENITVEDIAWHLSLINRFNGATEEHGITVASHSLFVCNLVYQQTKSNLLALHGLLHDAHEAYIGDITRPVKMLPGMDELLKSYSDPLQVCILEALGVPDISAEEKRVIKWADNVSLAFEAQHFMASEGNGWGLDDYRAPDHVPVYGLYRLSPRRASATMVDWFNTLRLAMFH